MGARESGAAAFPRARRPALNDLANRLPLLATTIKHTHDTGETFTLHFCFMNKQQKNMRPLYLEYSQSYTNMFPRFENSKYSEPIEINGWLLRESLVLYLRCWLLLSVIDCCSRLWSSTTSIHAVDVLRAD